MNFPSTLELSTFPDDIKYSILGISAFLLAVALGVLVWLVYRLFTRKARSQKEWNRLLSREDKYTEETVYGSNVKSPEAESKPHAVESLVEGALSPIQHLTPEDSGRVESLLTPEDSDLYSDGVSGPLSPEESDGVSSPHTPEDSGGVSGLLSPEESDGVSSPHTPEDSGGVSGPLTPEESDGVSSLLSPEDSDGVGDLPSPNSPQAGEQSQVQGSLHFSLQYDRFQTRLHLTVLGARDLGGEGFHGSMDPQVRVCLLRAGHKDAPTSAPLQCVLRQWQTRTVTDSFNPAFGDQFSCSLPDHDLPHVTVRLEVRDFNKYSRHEILGEVRVNLGSLNLSFRQEIQEDLQPAKKDPVGEVLLSLKYLPISQRLEVGLLKVKTLSQSPNKHRALYARTSIVCNRCSPRHQKTSQKTRWEVTDFNEVMIFALPGSQVTECSIVISVYEVGMGKNSSKRLIGQASLKKGKRTEDEHWSLMMRSLRQPVFKWHQLLI